MKRIIKRIFVVILSVIFVCSFSTYAYASEKVQPTISFCATLKIVSCPNASNSSKANSGILGHSFLIVENIGVSTFKIGHMTVPVGESITVGTYSNRKNHNGIWYNIEGYTGMNGTCYSLTTGLTGSQVATLRDTINAHDSWSLTKNCSYFAKTVWNSVNTGCKLSGSNPKALADSIKKVNGYSTKVTIPKKSINNIARHTKDGIVYDKTGAKASGD